MIYEEEIRRLGLKVEILSREIMVELIEKVMCEQDILKGMRESGGYLGGEHSRA